MAAIGKMGTLAGGAFVALALTVAPVGLSIDGGWPVDGKAAHAGPGNNGGGNNGGGGNSGKGGGRGNSGGGNAGSAGGGGAGGGSSGGGSAGGGANAGGSPGNSGAAKANAPGQNKSPGAGAGAGVGVAGAPGLTEAPPPGLTGVSPAANLSGSLNAAGAAESAFDNAADESTVGQLRAYRDAVLANDLAAAATALSEASNKPVTAADIEQVNEVLGIGPDDTSLSAEDIEAEVETIETSTSLP